MDPDRWFRLTIAVLVTWRLTHLLVMEDGPADIVVKLRLWLGNSFFGKLMDCFYCLSVWVAAPLAVLPMNKWSEWPLLWLAVSGAACLLERPHGHSPALQQTPPEEK